MNIDNIIVAGLVEGLTENALGIDPTENTINVSKYRAEELEWFLPRILVEVGMFKTTSEIRRIHDQRKKSSKIIDPLSKSIWRTIDSCEATSFKIGKKVFWLFVTK